MPRHPLYRADVIVCLKQMAGKGMPEQVSRTSSARFNTLFLSMRGAGSKSYEQTNERVELGAEATGTLIMAETEAVVVGAGPCARL